MSTEQQVHPMEDMEVITRLWYNNHANQLGDTVITIEIRLLGSYQLSITQVKLMTAEEALAVMESINEHKH